MNLGGRTFTVDKANGKIAGVCAGLGETLGVDATIVRIGFVLAAIVGHAFFAMIIVYAVLAVAGAPGGAGGRNRLARSRAPAARDEALEERLRAHDRRMKEIDTFVAGSNGRLAREIEELRK
jgi:phage shock protein C